MVFEEDLTFIQEKRDQIFSCIVKFETVKESNTTFQVLLS